MTTDNGKPVTHEEPKSLPIELQAVALVGADTCAAAGEMSASWWWAEVAAGRAPQPVIRGHRCTRWRLSDVRNYWAERAAANQAFYNAESPIAPTAGRMEGVSDRQVTAQVKASRAAQAKRVTRGHAGRGGAQ